MSSPHVIGKYPKTWHQLAAACLHLSLLPSAIVGPGLAAWALPLILWLILRGRSPLIDHHGQRAVNWGVWLAVVFSLFHLLAIFQWGDQRGIVIILLIISAVWSFVVLRRAVKAWQGKELLRSKFSWFG